MNVQRIDGHQRRLLGIYLNDHLMGSVAGSELARRCLRNNRGTPLGSFLATLLEEILKDRRTLEEVMARLDVSVDWPKVVVASVGERLARLKLNGQLIGYSDLSRVIELEALCAGVAVKRRLWHGVEKIKHRDSRIVDIDFARLADRASAQLDGIERHRLDAVERAFAGAP